MANSSSGSATFSQVETGTYRVSGHLVFDTARDLLRQSASAFESGKQVTIDLSQIATADSAGLALLIEWYRLATRAKCSLRLTAAPEQLRALAKISDIDEILPLA